MTAEENILMRNLSRGRTDADRKKANDLDNFKLWKRVYPDTFKNVIRAMNEHAESIAKERAVEFAIRNRPRFKGDALKKIYEKAYDTFLADKRKEGAE